MFRPRNCGEQERARRPQRRNQAGRRLDAMRDVAQVDVLACGEQREGGDGQPASVPPSAENRERRDEAQQEQVGRRVGESTVEDPRVDRRPRDRLMQNHDRSQRRDRQPAKQRVEPVAPPITRYPAAHKQRGRAQNSNVKADCPDVHGRRKRALRATIENESRVPAPHHNHHREHDPHSPFACMHGGADQTTERRACDHRENCSVAESHANQSSRERRLEHHTQHQGHAPDADDQPHASSQSAEQACDRQV